MCKYHTKRFGKIKKLYTFATSIRKNSIPFTRQQNVSATIYTKDNSAQLQLNLNRHNAQYSPIATHQFANFHDRFLIKVDTVYHIGALLKDLGKKWFSFCKMSISAEEIISKII